MSTFQSFIREYLDPVVKGDQCSQYVDEIGIAANDAADLTPEHWSNLLVQSPSRIETEDKEMPIWSRTKMNPEKKVSTTRRNLSTTSENPKFSILTQISKSKKALQRYLGFVNSYRRYISRIAEKLNPIYKFLFSEVPIYITSELKKTFHSVNKALRNECELAMKQPIRGKQLLLRTETSF